VLCGEGRSITLTGLDAYSRQGDKTIVEVLRSMGVPPKDIGQTLEWLLEGVMDDRLENRGAILKRAVRAELKKEKERKESINEGSTSL
jgi:hypothetical protein